jgi:hypothetical protein
MLFSFFIPSCSIILSDNLYITLFILYNIKSIFTILKKRKPEKLVYFIKNTTLLSKPLFGFFSSNPYPI